GGGGAGGRGGAAAAGGGGAPAAGHPRPPPRGPRRRWGEPGPLPRRTGPPRPHAGAPAGAPPRRRALSPVRCGDPEVARRTARHLLVPRVSARAVLTDVPGVAVGHLTDAEAGTGCTVVIPPPRTVGA